MRLFDTFAEPWEWKTYENSPQGCFLAHVDVCLRVIFCSRLLLHQPQCSHAKRIWWAVSLCKLWWQFWHLFVKAVGRWTYFSLCKNAFDIMRYSWLLCLGLLQREPSPSWSWGKLRLFEEYITLNIESFDNQTLGKDWLHLGYWMFQQIWTLAWWYWWLAATCCIYQLIHAVNPCRAISMNDITAALRGISPTLHGPMPRPSFLAFGLAKIQSCCWMCGFYSCLHGRLFVRWFWNLTFFKWSSRCWLTHLCFQKFRGEIWFWCISVGLEPPSTVGWNQVNLYLTPWLVVPVDVWTHSVWMSFVALCLELRKSC